MSNVELLPAMVMLVPVAKANEKPHSGVPYLQTNQHVGHWHQMQCTCGSTLSCLLPITQILEHYNTWYIYNLQMDFMKLYVIYIDKPHTDYIYLYIYIGVISRVSKTQTKKVHTDIQYVGSYAIRFQHWDSHEPWDFELNKPVDVAQEPSYGNKPWLLFVHEKSIQTNGWFSGTPAPPILGNHGQYLIVDIYI